MRGGYLGVGSLSLVILAGGAVACGSTGATAASLSRPATVRAENLVHLMRPGGIR
jgi:hypothetical protein